jgi:hypothetical protein
MRKDRSEYWLQRVYGARSTGELRESYDQWAPDYDRVAGARISGGSIP